jgi:hypothetical protein
VKDVLHVQGEKEEHREKTGERGQLGDVGESEPVDPEDRQRRERVGVALFVDDEPDQQRERNGDLPDRVGVTPADRGHLHERIDEQQHPARDQDGTTDIEVSKLRASSLPADQPEDPAEHEHGGDRVEEHHPTPTRPFGQQPAEKHAGGGRKPADAAPYSDRRVPVLALLKRGRQDRERGREHHRGTHALQEASADQDALAPGKPSDQRRDPEQHGAGDEHATAAQQIGGAASQQHEPPIGQEIGADNPNQAALRKMQVPPDRWKRDVDDRRVNKVKKRNRAQQRERELASARPEERRNRGG